MKMGILIVQLRGIKICWVSRASIRIKTLYHVIKLKWMFNFIWTQCLPKKLHHTQILTVLVSIYDLYGRKPKKRKSFFLDIAAEFSFNFLKSLQSHVR